MVFCSWVDKCVLQASNQPSLHNFQPAGLQVACSHQPDCYCMFLSGESKKSQLYNEDTSKWFVDVFKEDHGGCSYHSDPVCYCQSF